MAEYKSFLRWKRDGAEGLVTDPVVIQEIVNNNTFVTELTENNTFITELITQLFETNEFVTNLTENNEFITQVTENNTYVTSVTNITQATINGKKGVANELATLDADGKVPNAQMPNGSLSFVIDGGGSAITTGVKGDIEIPFNCTLTGWRLLADQAGSIVVDLWKDTYANYPPVVADTIISGTKPTLSSAIKNEDLAITDWTGEAVAANSIIRVNVDSAATVTRVTLVLLFTRT